LICPRKTLKHEVDLQIHILEVPENFFSFLSAPRRVTYDILELCSLKIVCIRSSRHSSKIAAIGSG
jgi:hypothetical protein